jgi:outer membrane protein OmpA-like peptidoglycan-associated protein
LADQTPKYNGEIYIMLKKLLNLLVMLLFSIAPLYADENSTEAIQKSDPMKSYFFETSSSQRELNDNEGCPAFMLFWKKHPNKSFDEFKQIDSDADGVENSKDKCPNTIDCEFKVNEKGCLQTQREIIHFEKGSDELSADAINILQKISDLGHQNYTSHITLIHHYDSTKAKMIAAKLLELGIRANRIFEVNDHNRSLKDKVTIQLDYQDPQSDDKDHDGVLDKQDKCIHPYHFRDNQIKIDKDGCVVLPKAGIHFAWNESILEHSVYDYATDFFNQFQEFCNAQKFPKLKAKEYTFVVTSSMDQHEVPIKGKMLAYQRALSVVEVLLSFNIIHENQILIRSNGYLEHDFYPQPASTQSPTKRVEVRVVKTSQLNTFLQQKNEIH